MGMTDVVVRRRAGADGGRRGLAGRAGGRVRLVAIGCAHDADRPAVIAAIVSAVGLRSGTLVAWSASHASRCSSPTPPAFGCGSGRRGRRPVGVDRRVEVADRGRLRDGQVTVVPARRSDALVGRRSRTPAGVPASTDSSTTSRWSSPFGLSTTVSVVDVGDHARPTRRRAVPRSSLVDLPDEAAGADRRDHRSGGGCRSTTRAVPTTLARRVPSRSATSPR